MIALLFSLIACGSDPCEGFLGDYSGTFSGDEDGDLVVGITANGSSDPIVEVTLDGQNLQGIGNGTFNCENGNLKVDLYPEADGDIIGSFDGTMKDGKGTGNWEITDGDSAGKKGDWEMNAD